LGLLQYSVPCGPTQEAADSAPRFRCRRCLLKGCERSYRPTYPQSRYCSDACQQAAQRWRRRQASLTWRASVQGKARRREQSQRYRRRIPLVVLPESPVPQVEAEPPRAAREGQRPATIPADCSIQMCQRPGCYELFVVSPARSPQRYCCGLCRQALRRVLDREERYRCRRRGGFRPPRRRSRPARSPPAGRL
jgi:hypothetical protein